MEKVSKLDIFGKDVHMYIDGQGQYRTIFGGILSIGCIIVSAIFAFMFGLNFLTRKNYRVMTETVVPQEYPESFKMNASNLLIPFGLEDNDGNPIHIKGLFFYAVYFQLLKNETTNEWDSEIVNMNITYCSDLLDNKNLSEPNINLDKYYCLDTRSQEVKLGGYWDGNFVNYVAFALSICPDMQTYNPENCTSPIDMKSYLHNTSLYFSIYYPQFYFSPGNLNNPLKSTYKNYYTTLDLNIQKILYLNVKETRAISDVGWVMNDINNKTLYSISDYNMDFMYYDDKMLTQQDSSGEFFFFDFYFQKDYTLFTRVYMKLQDFCALLGGFIKLLTLIGLIFSSWNNMIMKNNLLVNCMFSFTKSPVERNKAKRIQLSSKHQVQVSEGVVLGTEAKHLSGVSVFKPLVPHRLETEKKSYNDDNFIIQRYPSKRQKVKLMLDYKLIFKSLLCKNSLTTKENEKLEYFNFAKSQVIKRFDITFYISYLNMVDKFKSFILNREQVVCLNNMRKIVLDQEYMKEMEVISNVHLANERIKNYFNNKIAFEGLSEIDAILYDNLEVVNQ
jgi:hypothetical protein